MVLTPKDMRDVTLNRPLASLSTPRLDIVLWDYENESHQGALKYNNSKVLVELESGITINPDREENLCATIMYEVIPTDKETTKRRTLKNPVRIFLKPTITQQYRYFIHDRGKDLFPPSSNRFYSRLFVHDSSNHYDDRNTVRVSCSIHRCVDDESKFWLTISDIESGHIYESYPIHKHEINLFSMIEDTHSDLLREKRYADGIDKSKQFDIDEFLNSSPPTWSQLSKILEEITFPNLKRFRTLGETISQLIPLSFPEVARKSLCVFLGLLVQGKILHEDPDDVSEKFAPWNIVSSLYNNHQLYTLHSIKPPSYVRIMHLAARGQILGSCRTIREEIEKSDWLTFWYLIHNGSRTLGKEMPILLDIVEKSNKSGSITGRFIPSKSAGQRSLKAWSTRLVCNSSATPPSLVSTPNFGALGLQQVLYLGSAYCWPHPHMSYITKLGNQDNSPYLQRMIIPLSAVNRIKRFIPTLLEVSWSSMVYNPDLYSIDWRVKSKEILKSPARTKPLTTLRKKYYSPSHSDFVRITSAEALVLDAITTPFHMMYLKERAHLFKATFGIDKQLFLRTARSLIKRGVLRPQYVLIPQLPTLTTVASGKPKTLISMADAFLSGTPTCTAYICNNGTHAVFLSRVPPSDLFELANLLPRAGKDNGISIRCFRPTALRSYNYTLFQKLLQNDGTWDTDVSGFLSQARAKRAEIAKTAANKQRWTCRK